MRPDALEMVKRHDGMYPHTYLGRSLEDILREIDMTIDEFNKVCDRFTNKRLFQSDARGNLLRDKGFRLIKTNADNE